jgi:hypothetical protein
MVKNMIRTRVSAVLITRDAVTGRPLSKEVLVELDGEMFRPEYREGGYILFLNLPRGEYDVCLKSARYFDERLTLTADGDTEGRIVSLKPRDAYAVTSGGFMPGAAVTVAFPRAPEIKTAQTIEAGVAEEIRLICRSPAVLPALPGEFLLTDGECSERCTLRTFSVGRGSFAGPFTQAHKQGLALLPCAVYRADANGEVTAYLGSKPAYFLDEASGKLTELS